MLNFNHWELRASKTTTEVEPINDLKYITSKHEQEKEKSRRTQNLQRAYTEWGLKFESDTCSSQAAREDGVMATLVFDTRQPSFYS